MLVRKLNYMQPYLKHSWNEHSAQKVRQPVSRPSSKSHLVTTSGRVYNCLFSPFKATG